MKHLQLLFIAFVCLLNSINEVLATEQGWNFKGYNSATTFYYPFASVKKIHPRLPFEINWSAQANQLILTGDVNGDGELEIITSIAGKVIVRDANGDEVFSSFNSGATATSLALVDLDNNGSVEIIAADKNGLLEMIDCSYQRIYPLFMFDCEIKNISFLGTNTLVTQLGKVGEAGSVNIRKVVMSRIGYENGSLTDTVAGSYTSGADTEIGAVDDSLIVLQSYPSKTSPTPDTYNGTSDWYGYVICLDNLGNEKWVKQFGSSSTNAAISDIDGNGVKEIIVWTSDDENKSGGVYILNSATGDIIHEFIASYGINA